MKKLQIRVNVSSSKPKLVDINLSTNLVKLTFSEPKNIVYSFLKDERVASESVHLLQTLKPLFSISDDKESTPQSYQEKTEYLWSLDSSIDYFGILIPMTSTYYVMEFHSYVSSISNANGAPSGNLDITGHMSVENILFLIKESSLPDGLSKVIDIAVNVSTLQRVDDNSRSIQVESSHARICLSPDSLLRLLWGFNQGHKLSEHYLKYHSKSLWQSFAKSDDKQQDTNSIKSNETSFSRQLILSTFYRTIFVWVGYLNMN